MQNPFKNASEETKERTVKAIEKANSREYQHMKASYTLFEKVLEDILNDPFWRKIAEEAIEAREAQL